MPSGLRRTMLAWPISYPASTLARQPGGDLRQEPVSLERPV